MPSIQEKSLPQEAFPTAGIFQFGNNQELQSHQSLTIINYQLSVLSIAFCLQGDIGKQMNVILHTYMLTTINIHWLQKSIMIAIRLINT